MVRDAMLVMIQSRDTKIPGGYVPRGEMVDLLRPWGRPEEENGLKYDEKRRRKISNRNRLGVLQIVDGS